MAACCSSATTRWPCSAARWPTPPRGAGRSRSCPGEAGIGKTSLVRAFVVEATGRARLLVAACDDLMAPRTLGPLRDAAGPAGPLAAGPGR